QTPQVWNRVPAVATRPARWARMSTARDPGPAIPGPSRTPAAYASRGARCQHGELAWGHAPGVQREGDGWGGGNAVRERRLAHRRRHPATAAKPCDDASSAASCGAPVRTSGARDGPGIRILRHVLMPTGNLLALK